MHELANVQQFIQLPGCTLLRNGMQISGDLSDEQLKGIGTALNAMEQHGLWWWGDYMRHVVHVRGETYAETSIESHYSTGSLANAKWVCSKIDLSQRCEELSYSHHYEALSECDGNVQEALEWLQKAAEEKWSVSKLRTAIRASKAEYKPEGGKGEPCAYDYVKELQGWERKKMASEPPEAVRAVLCDLIDLVNRIQAHLAKAA